MTTRPLDPNQRLRKILCSLEVPASYYERAVDRYKSIEEWLLRPDSSLAAFEPRVYPQGSFRLGTAVRPVSGRGEYDLDIVCEFQRLSKGDLTQAELKKLLGIELEAYRRHVGIASELDESKRCWRLDYKDDIHFHIDNLPSLPESGDVVATIRLLGVPADLAVGAIAITCTEDDNYRKLCPSWPSSNPKGYGLWFENRCGDPAFQRRKALVSEAVYKSADIVPTYALRTPLQEAIQLLKRHRDMMFLTNPSLKPISIIITTLAAHAYESEENLPDALLGILARMPKFIEDQEPRIANPTNPKEDFANKWAKDRDLEQSFFDWHSEASRHFSQILSLELGSQLHQLSYKRLGSSVFAADAATRGVSTKPAPPAVHVKDGPRPWRREG